MKFKCEKCNTRYSIADEKVRHKILKIRCKVCSHVIVVRDPEAAPHARPRPSATGHEPRPAASEPAPSVGSSTAGLFDDAALPSGSLDGDHTRMGPAPSAGEDIEWYAAPGGNQEGPMPYERLMDMIRKGDLTRADYVWNEHLPDWVEAGGLDTLTNAFDASHPKPPPLPPRRTGSQAVAAPAAPASEPAAAPEPPAPAAPPAAPSPPSPSAPPIPETGADDDLAAPTEVMAPVPTPGPTAAARPTVKEEPEPTRPYSGADMAALGADAPAAAIDEDETRADADGLEAIFGAADAPRHRASEPPDELAAIFAKEMAPGTPSPGTPAPGTPAPGTPAPGTPPSQGGSGPLFDIVDADQPTAAMAATPAALTPPPQAKEKKGGKGLLILAVLLLIGGSVGLGMLIAPKDTTPAPTMKPVAATESPAEQPPEPPAEQPAAAAAAPDAALAAEAAPDAGPQAVAEGTEPTEDAPGEEAAADKKADDKTAPEPVAAATKKPTRRAEKPAPRAEKPKPKPKPAAAAAEAPEEQAEDDKPKRPSRFGNLDKGRKKVEVKPTAGGSGDTSNLPGTLSQGQISRVIRRHSRSLKSCYERQLKKDDSLQSSRATLSFAIKPSGGTTRVRLREKRYDGTYLQDCIVRVVHRWKFPKFRGKDIPVDFPLIFQASM